MATKKYEAACFTITPEIMESIERIADKNNMSKSYVVRILLLDAIKHINERNVFKMVV